MVAHAIIVSAQGPNPFFPFFGGLLFDLGAFWDQDLDQGLTILICSSKSTQSALREHSENKQTASYCRSQKYFVLLSYPS